MAGIKDFYRGDSRKYTVFVTGEDANGVEHPLSVHGGKLYLTMKSDQDLPDEEAEIHKSVDCVEADPMNPTGMATITLTGAETEVAPGFYWYDFQFVFADGSIKTILPEADASIEDKKVKIVTDITRTTT